MADYGHLYINGREIQSLSVNGRLVWQLEEPPTPTEEGLIFTSVGSATIKLTKQGSPTTRRLQYAVGNDEWSSYTPGTTVSVGANTKVKFRNLDEYLSDSTSAYYQFQMTGQWNGSGDVLAMVNDSQQMHNSGLCYLFKDCTGLLTAPSISPHVSNTYSMRGLFRGCTSMTTPPPELHNMETHDNGSASSWREMFYGCSSMTSAPIITQDNPRKISANECREMFRGCSSLNVTSGSGGTLFYDMRQTVTDSGSGRENMFYGCAGSVAATPPMGYAYYFN